MTVFENKKNRYLLYAGLFVFLLLHLYRLNAPPNGYHQWRESDTAAITLNYFQEDTNFLHPRCNQRGAGEGITGSELPIYNYTAAILYFVVGPYHAVPRLLSTVGGMVAILFFFLAVRRLSDEETGVWSALSLAFAPLFFFYSYKIMPDVWMLMFLLIAFYLFVRFVQEGGWGALAGSALALILSACLKPLGLSIYLPMLILLMRRNTKRTASFSIMAAYVAVTFGLTLGWYLYARHLNDVYGTPAYYMGHLFATFYESLAHSWFYRKLLLQWPPELWVGWTMVPVFLYGCYRAIRDRKGGLWLWWIAASFVAFVLVSAHSGSHDYYTMIIVPPLAAISGIGLTSLFRARAWKKRLAIVLIIIGPVGACVRVTVRFGPQDRYDAIRASVDDVIPRIDLVMVEEESMAIRLYQLNRHGWPIRDGVTLDAIRDEINRGGRWLVLDHPINDYDPELKTVFRGSARRIGPLYAYYDTESD